MGAIKPPTETEIKEAEYDPAHEPFGAYISPAYKPDGTWGLFVWVGVTDPSPEWMQVLARHKFLFVNAKPNDDKAPYCHPRREIDAVYNMQQLYKIDPKRVYISGFSAGGQIACFTWHFFPDVFKGGIFMSGNAFHAIYTDKTGRLICTVREDAPWQAPLEQIRKETSVVIMWGGAEYKADPTGRDVPRALMEGLILDGFLRVALFEIPRAGHNHPNAAWFEKAVTALERPIGTPHPPATGPTTRPDPSGAQIAQAQRLLATARWHVEVESAWNGRAQTTKLAKEALEHLLQDYPTTPAAASAKDLLARLDTLPTAPAPRATRTTRSTTRPAR